jgi:hypothetical protein
MRIEILGTGCRRCEELYENAQAASTLGKSIEVKKVADPGYFVKTGVFMTPGLIIDGKLLTSPLMR